ncbi:MAG: T9SS type A sorting domain-containing protein [Bacteroidales bacterium]|nr:T9SS type A sorting domain-containing protein [Bacteroidales bacterium]
MKKLFTLFIACAFATMAYAQLVETPISHEDNPAMERSDWFGYTSNASSAYIFNAESEYLLRVPAGSITPGLSITQVTFRHLTSESFSNYTGDPFANEVYFIRIYTGTHYETVTYLDTLGQEQTRDSLNPGTIAYEMAYTPEETGIQIVTLSQPFTVPNEDFCISIYAPDKSAGGLCPEDTTCIDRSYALMDETAGWRHYRFASSGSDNYQHKPWFLAAYYNDGAAYQPKSDWHTEIYDPENQAQYPDEITTQYVDSYTDSLYFYGGAFNMGIDSSYGYYYYSVYTTGENPIYFIQDQPTGGGLDSYQPNYGFRYGPVALAGIDELAEVNITFPFEMCFSLTYETEENYNGIDPNLDNNVYCITVTDEEPGAEDGIAENTNTLTVSPNPASTVIRVDNAAGAQISIFNIAGQEVMAIEAANANETINVANLTEGVYVVRVVNGNEVATSKVSIVR